MRNTIHIIIITETWLKSDDEAMNYQLPGYTHYYNTRTNERGGGVSIFVHNFLKHNIIEKQCLNGNHYLWVHLQKFSIDIGAVYRSNHDTVKNFLELYSTQLQNRKRALVFGDFNLNLLSSEKCVKDYKLTLKENSYQIINKIDTNHSTRETSSTRTILDHVCTNLKDNNFHLAIIESAMSDHKQIYFEVKKYHPKSLQKIKYEKINYENLWKTIENCKYENENNDFTLFEKRLLSSINKNKVTKIKILNPPRQDWINQEVIKEINSRNISWQQLKLNPENDKLKQEFKTKRNKVTNIIQGTKSRYYHKAFMDCKNNPSKMWKLINSLSANKTIERSAPAKLDSGTATTSDVKEMCDIFNTYFSNIGSSLADAIPKNYSQNTTYTCTSKPNPFKLFKFKPATTDEISKIIDNLNLNTSSGLDGLNTKSIKYLKNLIKEDLTNCINRSLNEGVFPNSLKLAKVSPIYKSGTQSDPNNYRPISVLPVISKVFEKVLYSRIKTYLDTVNFLYEKQYGFQPQSNTLSATIDIVTRIKVNIDNKQIALGIFIDLKKAFDTVSHSLLIQKLRALGIAGTALDILKSYLTNRHQIVKIQNHQSELKAITCGVPQGSILGPLLFLIYINNINELGLKGDITLYADDTSLFYFGNSISSVINDAQNDLDLLNTWFQCNLLTINISKTNYIIFAAKNKKIPEFQPLKINNVAIQKVEKEKYLGLILDKNLNWKPHIDKVKSKLTSLSGALRSFAKNIPTQVRYTIYNSLIKPHIDYLIEVWGTAVKTNLEALQIAQNKLIKVLFQYHYLTPTKTLYSETKLLNINQTYVYYNCLLVRKILKNDIRTQLNFTRKHHVQRMKLRNANDLILRPSRTNYGRKSILYEGAQLFNKLPIVIKETKSMSHFKSLLKNHVLKNF